MKKVFGLTVCLAWLAFLAWFLWNFKWLFLVSCGVIAAFKYAIQQSKGGEHTFLLSLSVVVTAGAIYSWGAFVAPFLMQVFNATH